MSGIYGTIEGRVGKIDQLQSNQNDKQWINVSVATDEWVGEGKGDLDRNNQQTAFKTTWVKLVAFGRTAQYLAEKVVVGDIISARGKLSLDTYQTKDTNETRTNLAMKADDVSGPLQKGSKGAGQENGNASQPATNGNGNGYAQHQAQQQQPVQQQRQAAPPAQRQAAPPAQRQAAPVGVRGGAATAVAAPPFDDGIPF